MSDGKYPLITELRVKTAKSNIAKANTSSYKLQKVTQLQVRKELRKESRITLEWTENTTKIKGEKTLLGNN